ncbi:hypothetical protein NC652_001771 [Populus alba x Populus x berolinensis]|nr:hypothetical protein NC652_001771 [Populus alba x Populus x berolinensis]
MSMKSHIGRCGWLNRKYWSNYLVHMKSHFKSYLECYWSSKIPIQEQLSFGIIKWLMEIKPHLEEHFGIWCFK